MATDHLSTTFAALADPTRRAILARLAQGEATVNELAEPFALSLPTISKHLKALRRAGLVSQGRKAQWRPCRLEVAPLHEVANWMEDYHRFWDESYDRLDDYLHELQVQGQSHEQGPVLGKEKFVVEKTDIATTLTTPSDREIRMTRVFDAPRGLVYQTHTDANHIPQWWGPRRLTTTVDTLDVRPGGAWRFVQRDPDGNEYAFRGEFREVVPPERLVFTFEYEGMPGHILQQTITFAEHDGKTSVSSTALFDLVEERDGMLASGMEAGATEPWDRLAELLERLR